MKKLNRTAATIVALSVLAIHEKAEAADIRAHVEGGAAHFLGIGSSWQGREIGTGMVGMAAFELMQTRSFGLEARLLAGRFLQGDAPTNPAFQRVDSTSLFGLSAGARWSPIWDDHGLWLGGSFGAVRTGEFTRPTLDLRLGWDFRLADSMRGGPFLGYFHVFAPSDNIRPEDGHVAMLGLHLAFDVLAAPGISMPSDKAVAPPKPKPIDAPKPIVAKAEPPPPPSPPPPTPVVEEAPPVVSIVGTEIVISDRILFDYKSAKISGESNALLESIANTILAHPEVGVIEIQGHTDDVGDEAWNQKLSEQRAAAVRNALIGFGVPGARLQSKGFGRQKPLAIGNDEAARRQNRRVEFMIQQKDSK